MANQKNNTQADKQPNSSSAKDLDDLNILCFPPDIDWSSTLIVKCDPTKAPYRVPDVYKDLHRVLLRNNVFTLGPTILNYVFTLSFKSTRMTESFVKYFTNRMNSEILVKGLPVVISRIPSECVVVSVRWVPIEVDSTHILDVLKQYGSVVKSESVQSNMRGWFHVYTNERKFTLCLHKGVDPSQIPFGIYVKGMLAAVHVDKRSPASLHCYHDGHSGNTCKYEGCPLFVPS